jgi:hypothetical protein
MWRREVRDGDSTSPKNSVNLKDAAATAGDRTGVIWPLETGSDLNANLVRLGTARVSENT